LQLRPALGILFSTYPKNDFNNNAKFAHALIFSVPYPMNGKSGPCAVLQRWNMQRAFLQAINFKT
jgi:hypothetical protein